MAGHDAMRVSLLQNAKDASARLGHHFYVTRNVDGKRVETTRTIGSVSKFPRMSDAWAEVKRRHQVGISGRMTIAALIESYEKTELPHKAHSTQEQHRQILHDYILVRWGKTLKTTR